MPDAESDADALLKAVVPERRRQDAVALDALFQDVTGWRPVVWPSGILGHGRYDYRYDSGRTGTSLATGFAPRKANMVLYIMPGYADFEDILARLGPHRKGKACLYLGALSKVELAALRGLIRAGLADLSARWPVTPT